MENSLIESVLKVCEILNANSVDYLIVGGTAVALHGYYRQSHDPAGNLMSKHDLDFWYSSTYDNYFRLLNALEELGVDVAEFREEIAPDPKKSFFRFEQDDFKLDFLPEIPGLSKFRLSFNSRLVSKIRDIEVPYLGYDDLVESKLILSRPKDIEDINQLRLRKNDSDIES